MTLTSALNLLNWASRYPQRDNSRLATGSSDINRLDTTQQAMIGAH